MEYIIIIFVVLPYVCFLRARVDEKIEKNNDISSTEKTMPSAIKRKNGKNNKNKNDVQNTGSDKVKKVLSYFLPLVSDPKRVWSNFLILISELIIVIVGIGLTISFENYDEQRDMKRDMKDELEQQFFVAYNDYITQKDLCLQAMKLCEEQQIDVDKLRLNFDIHNDFLSDIIDNTYTREFVHNKMYAMFITETRNINRYQAIMLSDVTLEYEYVISICKESLKSLENLIIGTKAAYHYLNDGDIKHIEDACLHIDQYIQSNAFPVYSVHTP